jgi:hypothetical protein
MTTTQRLLFASGLALLLLSPAPCWAQSGAAAAAEVLFEQARAEMAAGNYDAACRKLRESDKLDPAVGTKLNLADCEEKRGRLATAWELFKAAERDLKRSDDRYPIAKQRREALEAVVPRLRIELAPSAPAETTVRVGKADLSAEALAVALPLDPGSHRLVVSAPGHGERTFTVTLEKGKSARIEVAPGAKQAAESAANGSRKARAPGVSADRSAPSTGDRRTVAYVAFGVGGLGVVVGTVAGVLALGKKAVADKNCSDELRLCNPTGKEANDTGSTLATVSTGGFAVGLVGLGVGSYLLIAGGDDSESEVALSATVGPAAGQLSLLRRW